MFGQEKSKWYSREELYDLVWSRPMTKLAAEFGISDVALSKKCKKLGIPRPGLGYWRQVELGLRVKKTSLPKRKTDQPEGVTIYIYEQVQKERIVLAANVTVEIEQLKSNPLVVGSDAKFLHRLVKDTYSQLRKAKANEYGRVWATDDCLDVNVSKISVERSLLILDAMLVALEKHGFLIHVVRHDPYRSSQSRNRGTYLIKNEVELSLAVRERSNQNRIKVPESEKKYSWQRNHRFEYEPSGEIEFILQRWPLNERHWKDLKAGTLEDRLTDIVCEIIESAELVRIELEKREVARLQEIELRRQADLRRRLAEEENQRRKELVEHALSWDLAAKIRAYIDEFSSSSSNELSDRWLMWAHEHANRIDPLKNGSQINLMERVFAAQASPNEVIEDVGPET